MVTHSNLCLLITNDFLVFLPKRPGVSWAENSIIINLRCYKLTNIVGEEIDINDTFEGEI